MARRPKGGSYEIREEPGVGFGVRLTKGGNTAHLGYHPTPEDAQSMIDRHKAATAGWEDERRRQEPRRTQVRAPKKSQGEKPTPGGEPPPVNIYGRF